MSYEYLPASPGAARVTRPGSVFADIRVILVASGAYQAAPTSARFGQPLHAGDRTAGMKLE
jgi:hypothetical protein